MLRHVRNMLAVCDEKISLANSPSGSLDSEKDNAHNVGRTEPLNILTKSRKERCALTTSILSRRRCSTPYRVLGIPRTGRENG